MVVNHSLIVLIGFSQGLYALCHFAVLAENLKNFISSSLTPRFTTQSDGGSKTHCSLRANEGHRQHFDSHFWPAIDKPDNMSCSQDLLLVQRASAELETLRKVPKHDGSPFPRNCHRLLYQIPGNTNCIDCGSPNPEWASVTYGVLLCVNCSGRHRSYGVQISRVRSIAMDAWSHTQVLALLEGGNQQMKQFFHRHQMHGESTSALDLQYKTKAARFYKTHLDQHVSKVAEAGLYTGRQASRSKLAKQQPRRSSIKSANESASRSPSYSGAIAVR